MLIETLRCFPQRHFVTAKEKFRSANALLVHFQSKWSLYFRSLIFPCNLPWVETFNWFNWVSDCQQLLSADPAYTCKKRFHLQNQRFRICQLSVNFFFIFFQGFPSTKSRQVRIPWSSFPLSFFAVVRQLFSPFVLHFFCFWWEQILSCSRPNSNDHLHWDCSFLKLIWLRFFWSKEIH